MLRFLSIRYRLMLLSLLLGVSLIVTSLVLLNQTRNQNRLIGQLSHNIDVIVKADRAIQTFWQPQVLAHRSGAQPTDAFRA